MLDCLTDINRLRIVEIREIVNESPTVKTFTFEDAFCSKAKPGQFVMVWIPGVDEIPLSLSALDRNKASSITVAKVGEATEALHHRALGDILGIRGPFGNGYTSESGNVLIVGGGTGLASLVPLAENLAGAASKITFLLGAKTWDELLFLNRIEQVISKIGGEIVVTTEDGSYGLKGVVTAQVEEILTRERFDMIYTCGPEQMMRKIFLSAERYNTPLQACLERLMRCGIGLCGSCVMGGVIVCKDGPVLNHEQLAKIDSEFGRFKRDFSGRKTSI